MKTVLEWTLVVIAILSIVGLFVMTVLGIDAYVTPRLKKIQSGETDKVEYQECCPPGSGCNDPHKASRHCLRIEARRIAKVDELVELERVWSNAQGVSSRQRRKKAQALAEYGAVRDGIIARALRDAAHMIDSSRSSQVPQNLLPGVKGEVVADDNGRSRPVKGGFAHAQGGGDWS